MARLRRIGRWIGNRLKDLFYGPGNHYADLGRVVAAVAVLMMLGGQLWNIHLRKEIDLGPSGLGGGLAAVVTACAAFLAAKAWERTTHTDAKP